MGLPRGRVSGDVASDPADRSFTMSPPSLVGRLSSGTKMLFIMTLALMPLGLIALFASIQSAAAKRYQHVADAHVIAAAEARQIDLTVLRAANILRLAAAAAANQPGRCAAIVAEAGRAIGTITTLALFDARGRRLCASSDAALAAARPPRGAIGAELRLVDAGIGFSVRSPEGAFGIGTLPSDRLVAVLGVNDRSYGIDLVQGRLPAVAGVAPPKRRLSARAAHLTVTAPVSGGQRSISAWSPRDQPGRSARSRYCWYCCRS